MKDAPMTMRDRIETKLMAALHPEHIEVIDESHHHAGHAGARPGGETHYRVRCRAAAFAGLNRVARHRLVNDALSEEFAAGVHALALELSTPSER